jgi:hypothetical protein
MKFRVCLQSLIITAVYCSSICRSDESASIAKELCLVQDPLILESSGLATCRTMENAVWMHNDSGDVPRLFLVGLDGNTIGIVNVNGVESV